MSVSAAYTANASSHNPNPALLANTLQWKHDRKCKCPTCHPRCSIWCNHPGAGRR